MKRSTVAADRFLTFLLALIFAAVAFFSVCWWQDWLFNFPDTLSASWSRDVQDQSWYPWSVGSVGIVLAFIGLRFLVAHLRQHRFSDLKVPTTEEGTTLKVDMNAVLTAATDALEDSMGVRSVHASSAHEGRDLVCSFDVKVDPEADLAEITSDCDKVITDLQACVGRDDLKFRTMITSTSRKKSLPRVS